MKSSHATQGATIIMVVLFTLVLLAGILAASMRLGVSASQNVLENGATLSAQYAAESALGRASVRVLEMQTLLSEANISVPSVALGSELKAYAESYCGNTTWVSRTEAASGQTVSTCTVTPATTGTNQFDFFRDMVKAGAYSAVLPPSEASSAGTAGWWRSQLGQTVTGPTGDLTYKYLIQPLRVENRGNADFRFVLKLGSVAALGASGSATRVLKSQAVQQGEWWVGMAQGSFLDTVLFTNFHRSRGSSTINVNFTNQTFNGPVHTNEKFLFISGSTASFRGQVASAGCTNLSTLAAGSTSCTQAPGAQVGSTMYTPTAGLQGDALNADMQSKLAAVTAVNWNGYKPNFNADYRPMPTTANTQKADAQAAGLYLPAAPAINSVVLRAGDSAGSSPSTYNATTRKWTPAPTHQYITVTPASGAATEYRYASDRVLQQKISGVWTNVKSNFNGVIFSEGTIGSTDSSGKKLGGLSGPGRTASNQPLPALAPFAQMTVAGQRDLYLSGDLTMSETPAVCDPAAADLEACRAEGITRRNVLGLYVQGTAASPADISVTWDAPNDLTLHAMTMTSTGEMNVQYHNQLKNNAARGRVTLIGGLVENYYGAFGTTTPTGFGRDFNYDRRFLDNPGFGPPSFPISPVWKAGDASSVEKGKVIAPELKVRLFRSTWKQASVDGY